MYVTTDEVREVAEQLTENAVPNGVLQSLILRASRMFDLTCGVAPEYFEAREDGIATALTLYGSGGNFLKLPPYVAGSLDPTVTFPSGYTTLEFVERNGYLVRAENGIFANGLISPVPWYYGVPITVTAKWGYEATPEDVKQAVIELVINLWRETDPAHAQLRSIEGGPIREKVPPRVGDVARRYRAQSAEFV